MQQACDRFSFLSGEGGGYSEKAGEHDQGQKVGMAENLGEIIDSEHVRDSLRYGIASDDQARDSGSLWWNPGRKLPQRVPEFTHKPGQDPGNHRCHQEYGNRPSQHAAHFPFPGHPVHRRGDAEKDHRYHEYEHQVQEYFPDRFDDRRRRPQQSTAQRTQTDSQKEQQSLTVILQK